MKRFLKKFAVRVGIVFLVFSFLVLGLRFGLSCCAHGQVRDRIEALRRAGHPTTIAEIRPAPVPDAENAALLFKAVVVLLPQRTDEDFARRRVLNQARETCGEMFPEELKNTVEAILRAPRMGLEPVCWSCFTHVRTLHKTLDTLATVIYMAFHDCGKEEPRILADLRGLNLQIGKNP